MIFLGPAQDVNHVNGDVAWTVEMYAYDSDRSMPSVAQGRR